MSLNIITCVTKADRDNPFQRITGVGVRINNQNYYLSQEEVIRMIDKEGYKFYVYIKGNLVEVITSESRFENRYIKTKNDGAEPNNLLSLDACVLA